MNKLNKNPDYNVVVGGNGNSLSLIKHPQNKPVTVGASTLLASPLKSVFDFWPTKWNSFFDFLSDPVGIRVGGNDTSIFVEFDVPGFKKEEIKASVSNQGARAGRTLDINCRNQNKSAHFSSTIPYTANVDKEPEVKLENGILTVTFGRSEATKPKQLQIK